MHTTVPFSLVDPAVQYARAGYAVFPLEPGGKKPATPRGFKDAKRCPDQVRALWRNPASNIGLPTGSINGFFVVDVDEPTQWFELVETHGGELPSGPKATTDKGFHLYFAIPQELKGQHIRNRANLAGCFDVRGDGGYVVAPPSVHPNGHRYEFAEKLSTTPLPMPPAWLLDLIGRSEDAPRVHSDSSGTIERVSRYGQAALNQECSRIAATQEGGRNDALNCAAFSIGQLVAGGELSLAESHAALAEAATSAGLPAHEVDKTLTNGLEAGMQVPRQAPDESLTHGNQEARSADDNPAPKIHWSPPKPLKNELLPVEAFDPELLPEPLRDFVVDLSERKDNAPMDFGAIGVMVALSSLLGRKLGIHPKRHDDWLVIPNLWGVIVGRPSMKKTPTLDDAIRPLKRLEGEAKTDFIAASADYQAAQKLDQLQQKEVEKRAAKLVKQDKHSDAHTLLLEA